MMPSPPRSRPVTPRRPLSFTGRSRSRETKPSRLGTEWPNEHHAGAAIVPVRIVPGIVVHEHAETNARVVVRIPVRVAHIGVAVIAKKARIVVVLSDVVGDDVVVPVGVALRHDA